MDFEKTWSGYVETAPAGAARSYLLPARAGGRKCKRMQVMVRITSASGANLAIAAYIEHSPDGQVWRDFGAGPVITAGALGSTAYPLLISGDSDVDAILGEYLRVRLEVSDGVASSVLWGQIEVFEMRKPF